MRRKVVIVGGGTCALALSCMLSGEKFDVSVYDVNKAPGRKFLVAGDGGLNITHAEPAPQFIMRYTPQGFIAEAFKQFSNTDLVTWLSELGIPTFTGSSGRVFPEKQMKPVDVLNVFLDAAQAKNVRFFSRHKWLSWNESENVFEAGGMIHAVRSDYTVFCMGGASWPVTGSTGEWINGFLQHGIRVNPFRASNCRFIVRWPRMIIDRHAGRALKNISVKCGDQSVTGEVVIAGDGIEGSGIYPLSPSIRHALDSSGVARVWIDLKPQIAVDTLRERISKIGERKAYSEALRTHLNLDPLRMTLLKCMIPKDSFRDAEHLSGMIKEFPVDIIATGPAEDAISTVGGIDLSEISGNFELLRMKNTYAIGEMLDYDAPTGGYLLQSCFTMAARVASHLDARF